MLDLNTATAKELGELETMKVMASSSCATVQNRAVSPICARSTRYRASAGRTEYDADPAASSML